MFERAVTFVATSTLAPAPTSVPVVTYTCDGQCNLHQAIRPLLEQRPDPVLHLVAAELTTHPDRYVPAAVDSFRVTKGGQALVELRRAGSRTTGTTAVVNYDIASLLLSIRERTALPLMR